MSLKIYRPMRTNKPGQKFGQNLACQTPDGRTISAIRDGVCPIGSELLYPKLGMKGHTGEDWGLYHGEPLYHCGDYTGKMKTEVDRDGGIGVDVISTEPLVDGKHVKLRYWHLKSVVGWDGKEVKPGDLIAYGDNTGLSSGDHLHFGLKFCDKNGTNLEPWNGYVGASDQAPYSENVFILDVLKVKQQALTAIQLAQKVVYQVMKFLKGRDIKNG